MTSLYIYAVYLEEDKYFIYCDKIERDYTYETDKRIMERCKLLNDYTKKYPPVSVDYVDSMGKFEHLNNKNALYEQSGEYYLPELAELLSQQQGLLIDYYVKKYMCEFGIENVRGGTYSQECLEEYMVKTLMREIENAKKINANVEIVDGIEEKIALLEKNFLVEDKKQYVESIIGKYYETKNNYEENMFFRINNIKFRVNANLTKELQWLKSIVNSPLAMRSALTKNPFNDEKILENYERYKILVACIKHIVGLYNKYYGDYGNVFREHEVYMNHPEFLFDKYIYHNYSDNNDNQYNTEITGYTIELFFTDFYSLYNSVINRLTELEFDFRTFSDQFEKEATSMLWYFINQNELNKNPERV
jgi:hypothetical protein